jgi:hypothetical protein
MTTDLGGHRKFGENQPRMCGKYDQFTRDWPIFVALRIFIAFTLLLSVMFIWVWRVGWAKFHPEACRSTSSPPRLIVGLAIQIFLFLAAFYFVTAYATLGWGLVANALRWIRSGHTDYPFKDLDMYFTPFSGAVWVISLLLIFCLWVLEDLVRLVLHVVTDVVNHFNRPSEQFPIRMQIEARFP